MRHARRRGTDVAESPEEIQVITTQGHSLDTIPSHSQHTHRLGHLGSSKTPPPPPGPGFFLVLALALALQLISKFFVEKAISASVKRSFFVLAFLEGF